MALTVTLNGQPHRFAELNEGATLAEAIERLGIKADRVAVERNGDIVARSAWAEVQLAGGDRLEVVHFVGGGAGKCAQELGDGQTVRLQTDAKRRP